MNSLVEDTRVILSQRPGYTIADTYINADYVHVLFYSFLNTNRVL